MKNIYNYIFNRKKIFIVFLICVSLLSANKALAADKWFYWVDTEANEMGIMGGTTGYASKAACEGSTGYRGVGTGHTKSNGCYSG